MAITLANAKLHYQNPLVPAVARTVIDVNTMFQLWPMEPIQGDAILYNWEDSLGGQAWTDINGSTPSGANNDSTVERKSASLVRQESLAQVDNYIQATSDSAGNNQLQFQIDKRVRKMTRELQSVQANGKIDSGTETSVDSFKDMTHTSKQFDHGGSAVTLRALRDLMGEVKAKDGQVDWLVGPRTIVYDAMAALEALGGTTREMTMVNPFTNEQRSVFMFDGVMFFINDFMTMTEDADGTLPNETGYSGSTVGSVYAGVWDEGTRDQGVALIVPAALPAAGFSIREVGQIEGSPAEAVRIEQYANNVNFNKQGMARLYNIAAA